MYKLLIVDDEPLERFAIRQTIMCHFPLFQEVKEGRNGCEAVEISRTFKPNLVLMDIRMPDKSGLEACKEIKEELPQTKIIFLSAFEVFDYAQTAIKVGASDYLLKPVRSNDLLECINNILQKMKEEQKKLEENIIAQQKLAKLWPHVKTSFVHDLLNGIIYSEEEINAKSELLGLNIFPAGAMLINITKIHKIIKKYTKLQCEHFKEHLLTSVSAAIGKKSSTLIVPNSLENIVVILGKGHCSSQYYKKYATNKATDVAQRLKADFNIDVTIGIGNLYNTAVDIRQSYLEALTAQRRAAFGEEKYLLHYEDLAFIRQDVAEYPFPLEQKLQEKVCLGNNQEAQQIMVSLWREINKYRLTEDMLKVCALELFVILYRAAISGGAGLNKMALLNIDYMEKITSCSSSAALKEWLLTVIQQLTENVLESKMTSQEKLVQMAKVYIDNNYQSNLTLQEIAAYLHFGPSYVSRVFKEKVGISLKKYIIQKKLIYAQRQLVKTQKPINQISWEIGYEDYSYFSRLFKKEYGVSPKTYRSKKSQ